MQKNVDTPNTLGKDLLQVQLLRFSFLNLLLVSLAGLMLRSYAVFDFLPLNYKKLLHAHSHFAFGGWAMPVLVWMIMNYFPEVTKKISYHHLRNIVIMILFSAYGMLLSFPWEGYGAVSIAFSTLSIIAGFYLSIVLWKPSAGLNHKTSIKFLRAGLFYFALSAIGPFATGPLVAMGKEGTDLYFNAIYFYLHFQYNGWFTFVILAVLYSILEQKGRKPNGTKTFFLFNVSCIPAYFLSTLWSHPGTQFYFIGGVAALLQLTGLFFLFKDLRNFKAVGFGSRLMRISLFAFAIKNVLQFISSWPYIASLAYDNRNFIIAYLHLVLLGFVSLFAFAAVLLKEKELLNTKLKIAMHFFLFSFVTTEFLLVAQATTALFNFYIPSYPAILFLLSCFFPLSILLINVSLIHYFKKIKTIFIVQRSDSEKIKSPEYVKG